MARYITDLNECSDPTSGDYLLVTDASAGATDKERKLNLSKLAILANAQSFTGAQTFAPTGTSTTPVAINLPASTTARGLDVSYNGTLRSYITAQATATTIGLENTDGGSSVGPRILLGRNSNASTPSAGQILFYDKDNDFNSVWVDGSGNLRIWQANQTTNATDTSGTVVGAQTSYAALKTDISPWDGAGALDAVVALPLHSYRFIEDESARQYRGIVITDNDRGAWFSFNDNEGQTPALNERNLFGYLIAAIQQQQVQIDKLRQQVAACTA